MKLYILLYYLRGIYFWWLYGHECVSFQHLYTFVIAHSQTVATSNVDLVDDCYLCDDLWPVC